MAIFTQKYISQGSVATNLRFGGIFSNHFTTNLLTSLPVKECWKCVKIWRELLLRVWCIPFWDTVYINEGWVKYMQNHSVQCDVRDIYKVSP